MEPVKSVNSKGKKTPGEEKKVCIERDPPKGELEIQVEFDKGELRVQLRGTLGASLLVASLMGLSPESENVGRHASCK